MEFRGHGFDKPRSTTWRQFIPLQWRHNEGDSVWNHQPHDCLLNRLFRRRSKKTSKLRVTGLWVGNSPGTGEFPAQMASNAENVSIWWRHHSWLALTLLAVQEICYRIPSIPNDTSVPGVISLAVKLPAPDWLEVVGSVLFRSAGWCRSVSSRMVSMLAITVGGGMCLWDLGFMASGPHFTEGSNSLIVGFYSAVRARRHVVMSPR